MNDVKIKNGLINGVQLISINGYDDQTGSLSVLISQGRKDAPDAEKIGEIYLVSVNEAKSVRGKHKHELLDEFFIIINGSAEFFLIDDRADSSTKNKKESFILNSRYMKALFVPCGVYHAFVTLEDNTRCLAISNDSYDRNKPDTYPIPFSNFK